MDVKKKSFNSQMMHAGKFVSLKLKLNELCELWALTLFLSGNVVWKLKLDILLSYLIYINTLFYTDTDATEISTVK